MGKSVRGVMVCLAAMLVTGIWAGRAVGQCLGDTDGDGRVAIDDVVRTVNEALNGCTAPTQRFVDNGDGTITDHQTRLMWEKKVGMNDVPDAGLHDVDEVFLWANLCSQNHAKWCQPTAAAAAACAAGVPGDATWCAECLDGDGACSYYPGSTIWDWVARLNAAGFAGHADWRVPTVRELVDIVDYSTYGPAVDVAFHGTSCGASCTDMTSAACSCTQSGFYSSSATDPFNPDYAGTVNFLAGNVFWYGKGIRNYVRAVRPGG